MNGKKAFKEFINNCEKYRRQYPGLLSPFFNAKEVRKWRNMLFILPIDHYYKVLIWEYLNHDIEKEDLEREL